MGKNVVFPWLVTWLSHKNQNYKIPNCNLKVTTLNDLLGPLPWALNGEMFSEEAKSKSSALSTATNWTTTFLVSKLKLCLQQIYKTVQLIPSGHKVLYQPFQADQQLWCVLGLCIGVSLLCHIHCIGRTRDKGKESRRYEGLLHAK